MRAFPLPARLGRPASWLGGASSLGGASGGARLLGPGALTPLEPVSPFEGLRDTVTALSWAARPAAIYLISRAAVLLATGVAVLRTPGLTLGNGLERWDSGWYLLLSANGYPHALPVVSGHVARSTTAFFPLFPMTVNALSSVTGLPYAIAGLALSSAFGLVAALLIWLLARDLWGSSAANRACAAFCFFPGAFVLSMVYAEGLMIALAAGCLLALSRRRWLWAGVLAALATATRPNAIALGFACAWVAGVAVHRRREWASLIAPALAPVGILAFFGYLWARTGNITAWFATESQGWHESLDLTAAWTRITAFAAHPFPNLNDTVGLVCIAFVIVAGAALTLAKPPGELLAYAGVVIALTLVSKLYGTTPRFLLTAFPLAMVLGYRLRGVAFGVALSASAVALGWLTVVNATSFLLTP